MTRKHSTLPLALLALVAGPAVAQEFEGVLTTRMGAGPEAITMLQYLGGGKIRSEMTGGAMPFVMIADPAAHRQIMVMPAQRAYMEMSMDDLERTGREYARAQGLREEGSDFQLRQTGVKATVAGLSCEDWEFSGGGNQMTLCLTPALGKFVAPMSLGAETPAWARQLAGRGDLFPLRATANGQVMWEVVAVERKRVDPSLFAVPEGYQKMAMPDMPGVRP